MKTITILEFTTDEDHSTAEALCKRLGYGTSYAYATSSDLPGLYCLPLRASQPGVVICKSVEFGMIAVQTFDDLPAQPEALRLTRVNNDCNGNPRYVAHFLQLNTRAELDKAGDEWIPVSTKYAIACKRANGIGGGKYRAKSYGGGIVFQGYPDEIAEHVSRVTGRKFIAEVQA